MSSPTLLSSVIDALRQCLYPYIPCCTRTPPSPPLSAQEGELEGLLDDSWREHDDDALSLHNTRMSSSRLPNRTLYRNQRAMPGTNPPPYSSEDENDPSSSRQPADLDEDAPDLDSSTLARLPELAKKYEPEVTLEDLAREEALQEERERMAERASGLHIYSPPVHQAEEFGGFQEASNGERSGHASGSRIDDEAEDTAEVSFGLGEADDEDEAE